MRLSRAQRISRDADIRRIQAEGKSARTRHLSLRSCASPLAFSRVGIIVPRHGRSAVDRNRLKRRLREIVRQEILPDLAGVDLLIRAAPGAYALAFGELRAEVASAVARLGR